MPEKKRKHQAAVHGVRTKEAPAKPFRMPLQPENGKGFVGDPFDYAVIAFLDDGDFRTKRPAGIRRAGRLIGKKQPLMVRAVDYGKFPVKTAKKTAGGGLGGMQPVILQTAVVWGL